MAFAPFLYEPPARSDPVLYQTMRARSAREPNCSFTFHAEATLQAFYNGLGVFVAFSLCLATIFLNVFMPGSSMNL